MIVASNMIGQAPPDTYSPSVNGDCNGNTWKDQPRGQRQDRLHTINACPELTKSPSVPQQCLPNRPQDVTTEAQLPVMPSVVAGSVEGNVGTTEITEAANIPNGEGVNPRDDKTPGTENHPVRSGGIDYLFERLGSMKRTVPIPQEDDTPVSSSPASPGDLSMTCVDDELGAAQLLDGQEHLEAIRKYREQMETYMQEMERYVIEKHGLDKKKSERSTEGHKLGLEEMITISRGTQAGPPEAMDQDVVIGPAIEMDLSDDRQAETGESCYTRELEALTNSLPSTSPLKIPTTRTKIHLAPSAPKNRFHRPSSEVNTTLGRSSAAIINETVSSQSHQRPTLPSAIPDDWQASGADISQSTDHHCREAAMGSASGVSGTSRIPWSYSKTNLCPSTITDVGLGKKNKQNTGALKSKTPKTPKHLQASNRQLPQTATLPGRVNSSRHSVPLNKYPFSDVDKMVKTNPFIQNPNANASGTLNTNCHVTPSYRNGPNPSCQVTQSEKHGGTDWIGASSRVSENSPPQEHDNNTLASLLGSPIHISPPLDSQAHAGQYQTRGGLSQEGYRMQAPGGKPPSNLPSVSNQRVSGYYGYGMFYPQVNQHGQNPWMNGYQNSPAHASKPPPAQSGHHPTRDTPPSAEAPQRPPKRQRSSSGNRAKRRPSGDQLRSQGKEVDDSNTYHYRPEYPLASQFEKTYQDILNRRLGKACPNVSVQHPWRPLGPNGNVPPPSQQLASSFLRGPWFSGQQAPVPNMMVYPQPFNDKMYTGSDSGSSRPNFYPGVQHPERPTHPLSSYPSPTQAIPTHPPPAYRPTGNSQLTHSTQRSQPQSHPGQHSQRQSHPGQHSQQQSHLGQHNLQQSHPGQHNLLQSHQGQHSQQQSHPSQHGQQQSHPAQHSQHEFHPGQHSQQLSHPGQNSQQLPHPGPHNLQPSHLGQHNQLQSHPDQQDQQQSYPGQHSQQQSHLGQHNHRQSQPGQYNLQQVPAGQHSQHPSRPGEHSQQQSHSGQHGQRQQTTQQRMHPPQQTRTRTSPPGNQPQAACNMRPTEYPMNQFFRMSMMHQPPQESAVGQPQPSIPRSGQVAPNQKRGTSQGAAPLDIGPPPGRVVGNVQNAVREILAANRAMSPPEPSNPVSPSVATSSKQPSGVSSDNWALDLSHQPVMPQITLVRGLGESNGPGVTLGDEQREPVMPKIVMVQTEKPPCSSGVDPLLFSRSLEQMASLTRPPLTIPQSHPDASYMGERGPPGPWPPPLAEHHPNQVTAMRLKDHVTTVIEHTLQSDGILNVPDLTRRLREENPPNLDPLPQRKQPEQDGTTIQKGKQKEKKIKEKRKSQDKKRTPQEEQIGPSPNPVNADVQSILPTHFLKVPDVTRALTTSRNVSRNALRNTLSEKDLHGQPLNVPYGPLNPLEATQEWVNQQFTATFHRMHQPTSESSEPLHPLPDIDSTSTPLLSSLLDRPIVSYRGPFAGTQQGQLPSVTSAIPSTDAAAMIRSHPVLGASPAVAETGSGDDDKSLPLIDGITSPMEEVVDATVNSTSVGPDGTATQKGEACPDAIPRESINSLVDMWEGMDQTENGRGIIADAANAAGITDDSDEEEIVISIPLSEGEPPAQQGEQSNECDGRTPDEEGNIFDRIKTFAINRVTSSKKDYSARPKSHEGLKDSTPSRSDSYHPEMDKQESTSTTSPPGASGRLKNCTLRLVPRKRKEDPKNDNNVHHKILPVTSLSEKDGEHGASHDEGSCKHDSSHARGKDKLDSANIGKSRYKSWHSLSPKVGSKAGSSHGASHSSSHKSSHSSSHKSSHGKHSSRPQTKHPSSHHHRKGGKRSHEKARHRHSTRHESGSNHHVSHEKLSRVTLAKVSSNDARTVQSAASKDKEDKVDRYYGYKRGTLPQHQHNTRFRIVCCHCEEMMPDNVAYMEHVEAVIEKSIPTSKIKQLCKVCYKAQPKDLQRHLRRAHLDGGRFLCKICNFNFQAKKELRFHMKKVHKSLTMPYICKICLFRTSFHSDLKQHFIDEHRGTKALLCHFCTKILYSSRSFLSHFTKHFAKESGVSCHDCVLLFLNNTSYKEHLMSDHKQLDWTDKDGSPLYYELPDILSLSLEAEERKRQQSSVSQAESSSQRAWKCLECGGSYIHLVEHLITKYRCQTCPYYTNCSSAYTQHVVSFHSSFQDTPNLHPVKKTTVLGGQLLRCKRCGYKTSYATNMAKHVVCCPEGLTVVDSFDYLRHRAQKELALRDKFDRKEKRLPETVITVDTDAMVE